MKFPRTLIAATLLSLAPSAFAADAVATVNGKPIKQSVYDYIAKDTAAQGQKVDANVREAIIAKLVETELLSQEAQKLGLDKQTDYLIREELSRRNLLSTLYVQDYIKKNPVSDADMKAAYEQYKKDYGDKELNVRHILVKTEAEAKDIIAQLNKGGDFAKIAKEKSIDMGSKEKGGDLGWFSPTTKLPPALSNVAANLPKGGISNSPVQTQFGWHVIKLIDTRPTQYIPYEKLKDEIQRGLQQRNVYKMITDLRNKSKVDIAN